MTESFTELAKRDQTIVPDRAGTPVDIATADHELLIDVFLFLKEREARFKEMRTQVEDELVRRHGNNWSSETVGDFQVEIDRGRQRTWDVDDAEATVAELVERGVLSARDVAGIIKTLRSVDGNIAKRLLDHGPDEAVAELERCFRWAQKGRAKVKVTPVASLEP